MPYHRCQVSDRPMEVDGDLRCLLVAQLLELGLEDNKALQHLRATGCVMVGASSASLSTWARFARQKRR